MFQLLLNSIFEATETELNMSNDEDDMEPEFWTGNPNRKLWKASCIRAALSVISHLKNVYSTVG